MVKQLNNLQFVYRKDQDKLVRNRLSNNNVFVPYEYSQFST